MINMNSNNLTETLQVKSRANGFSIQEDPKAEIRKAVEQILHQIGEDPTREGLLSTPDRVSRMYDELTSGHQVNLEKMINGALFDVEYDEMVIVKDIDFFSLCEHHMLPFFGRAHVAYIPNKKVIGLSKIPRMVEMYTRRLQVQERMTTQIAETMQEVLDARGVAVVVEGMHMCSMMRGVKKANASMSTSRMLGEFRSDPKVRAEFLDHLHNNRLT